MKTRRTETRDTKLYLCCPGTGSYDKISKACDRQTGYIPPVQARQKRVEIITHIFCSCSQLAGNPYRKRHDKVGKRSAGFCARNLK